MSSTSISLIVYSIYLGTAGTALALIPNIIFPPLNLPGADQVWCRLFGFLAIVLSVKGIYGALQGSIPTMQLDTITRACFSVFFAVLVFIGISPRVLIIFAIIDFVAAVWTQVTIIMAKRQAGQAGSQAA